MTPKLPRRPKHIEARKGFEYTEPESKRLPVVFESIVENVKQLERESYELANVRATLLVNFTNGGKASCTTGVDVKDADKLGTLPLLVAVLEGLVDAASKKAEMTLTAQNAIIRKTMSSGEWKADVSQFPVEWRARVESAMAKALGHGLYEAAKVSLTQTQ